MRKSKQVESKGEEFGRQLYGGKRERGIEKGWGVRGSEKPRHTMFKSLTKNLYSYILI